MGLSEDQKLFLIKEYGSNNVMFEFSTNQLSKLLNSGYKFCTVCYYLAYTEDLLCALCRKKTRTTVRNPSKKRMVSYAL